MTADIERQLKIARHITQSKLRTDIILVSEATKQLVLLELTVPWEDRMEEAQRERGRSSRSWWRSAGGMDGRPDA